MAPSVTWSQALAWRLERQLLQPNGGTTTEGVVERLCAVQTQVASSAELGIRVRRRRSADGDVAAALAEGRIIKTWAMRGSLHLLTPVLGAAFLSLIASGRSWARPSWQRYFGVTPDDIEAMREAAREVLGERELSREELVEGLVSRLGFEHLDEAFRSGWGTLFKPLAWQGDLCFGAPRGNRVTFVRPEVASPGWRGVPDPDDAAPLAIGAYLRAYGPATIDNFGAWLAGGWFGQRRLRTWFGEMGDQLAEVDVEGRTAWVVREDLEGLLATRPKRTVRLLPGFDAWVLGPGTADPATLPAHRRTAVSRQAGWISPIVVVDGVVSGTWQFDDDDVRVAWFEEAGRLPRSALVAEVERLAGIVGRELRLATETVP